MATAVRSPVTTYAEAVVSGEVVTGEFVKLACARHLEDLKTGPARGLKFDDIAAGRALGFFGFLRHSKGEWAGREFVLSPWQQFVVGSIFGWKREYGRCPQCDSWLPTEGEFINCIPCHVEDEDQLPAETGWFRRFRQALMEVARKNGKSTLAAGVGLLLAFFDDEPGAEVYTTATKRDQAKIIWLEAKRMVQRSPELRSDIQVNMVNLSSEATASKFEPLSSDANSTDGLGPNGNLVDELHAHKTRDLWDVMETAMGARRQPLTFAVTTAGTNRESIWWEVRDLALQVLNGTVEDDSIFAFIACLDEGDDYRDQAVWIKANPNLGVSVKMDYLVTQCKQAEAVPAKQNTFKRLHCNLPTQQVTRWIDMALWERNEGTIDESGLKGRTCYGMLDLATVSDMTAWVMVFPDEDDPDQIDVLARFWCPAARLKTSANRYRSQYQTWADQGYLIVTPGNATDYSFVKAQVLKDAAKFGLVDMNVDRLFQGHQLAYELTEELGERYDDVANEWVPRVFGMGMGFTSWAAPMTEFLRRLLAGKINHGGNPILRWNVDNLAVKQDPAGNFKPDKAESQGKIDGFIGIGGALDRAMRHQRDEDFAYKERGIATF